MAHDKNHIVRKPDETVVQVDVPGKDLKVLIPDNRYAYGDKESVAQMAQDVVGKHANNSNKAATKAYEQARQQLETTDFDAKIAFERRQRAIERVRGKKPAFTLVAHEDAFGFVKGYTVLTKLTHASGLVEHKEKYYSVEQLTEITSALGD